MKRRPVIISLLVSLSILLAGSSWLLGTASGNRQLLQWTVGEQLRIGSLQGSLFSSLQLHQLDYRDTQLQLTIDSLQLQWQPMALWHGLLHIRQLRAQGISYTALQQAPADSEATPPVLPVDIQLDRAELNNIQIQDGSDKFEIKRIAVSATTKQQQIRLASLELDYDSYSAMASGQLQLTQQYPFSLQIDWYGDVPQLGAASGSARLSGDSTGLEIKHSISKPFTISTNGSIDFSGDTGKLDLHGEWQQFSWPLQAAVVQSDSGSYQLTGPLQQPKLDVSTTLLFPDGRIPDIKARLQGNIDATGIREVRLETELLGGKANASGNFSWLPQLDTDLAITAESIDPSRQWPDWPGRLSLQAMLQAGNNARGLWLNARLKQLSGTLQQQPITANGNGRYDHSGIKLQSLQLRSGPNQLQLQGHAGDTLDLQYVLHAPDLAAFWPALKGQIDVEGKLTGSQKQPEIDTRFSASALHYAGHALDKLAGKLLWNQGQANGELLATGLHSGDWQARQLSFNISGTPEQHAAQLSLDATDMQLEARLAGGWQAPLWHGQLQQLQIRQQQIGQWHSRAASNLTAGASQVRLEALCLTHKKSKLCSDTEWTPSGSRIEAQLDALPLTFFTAWLPPDVSTEGDINGKLELHGPTESLQGQAQLELPRGTVQMQTDEEEPLRMALRDGVMTLKMSPQNNQAELHLKAGDSEISANLQTASLDPDSAALLSGKLNVQLPDLQTFSMLVPGLADIKGQLSAAADLGGTLRRPEIRGYMTLDKASANVPQLGIALEEIHISAKNRGSERLLLQGGLKSGGGPLSLDGELLLDAAQGWPLTLQIKGENVQLVRLPEAEAFASPDLNIKLNNKQLIINGKLLLPKADIHLKQLPKSAVSVSEDEVIVGKIEQQPTAPPLDIDANVEVQVGEQVRFDGFGLNTRLSGKVDLHSQQGRNLAQGELQLKDGRYKAYGQDLSIKQGRLLFNGPPQNPNLDIQATRLSVDGSVTAILSLSGSLNKPLVQVSSIPSLPEEEALAYLVTGQGLDAESPGTAVMLRQALASKGLEKSQQILDQLAKGLGVDEVSLQEGSSLEDTSLLLGKYLSPDLYVSYAVGLFDNQGALVTRYRLSKRLRLEVQSGTAQSMDLIYDVEK